MNGLLVVDKAAGMTSHDVVNVVRRATGERSVGHLGTLDPMATGVLPLLLGKYTRLAQYFGDAEKSYTGTIRFGWSTDSFDGDGERVGEIAPLTLGFEELCGLASRFHGEMEQVPPVFSAKKINGVPAYKLARAGKEAPVKAARITIHRFALTGLEGEAASFEMSVSAGGYVRSVAQELGQMAGCGAHLASLRRTAAGAFGLDEAVTVEELKSLSATALEGRMVHPRRMLPELPAVTVDDATAGKLRNGMQANVPEFTQAPLLKVFVGSSDLMAIAKRVAGTLVQPVVVMG
jgi:tRNA pseudouridine55 synthase